jgi:hypothetical protein
MKRTLIRRPSLAPSETPLIDTQDLTGIKARSAKLVYKARGSDRTAADLPYLFFVERVRGSPRERRAFVSLGWIGIHDFAIHAQESNQGIVSASYRFLGGVRNAKHICIAADRGITCGLYSELVL